MLICNCDCLTETPGKSIVPYIDHDGCNVSNLREKRPLAVILKSLHDRLSSDCLVTRKHPITVISIPFKATVKLTSITIKTTCKTLKVYRGKGICGIDWKNEKNYQEVQLNGHFVTAYLASSQYGEINRLLLVLEGDDKEEDRIFYLDIKGSFVRGKQQPVIAKYEVISSEIHSTVKNNSSFYTV